MELIREFKDLGKNDANIAGGKGASLGEMTRAGIPVPPGFVVLAGTFEKFLEETDLDVEVDAILDSVHHQDINSVEKASEKIQALILRAEIPKDIELEIEKHFKNLDTGYVAVRSSATAEDGATAAWAGQLDSYLNTIEETLLKNVKRCWASLFTPRAIFYRFEKDLHKTKISVAVVVQKMVESYVSGVAFSVHPVTEDRNQLIIEAGFGLGEAIVSGSITPDSYVVEKEPRRIIDKNVASQTKAIYRAATGGDEWRDISEEKASQQKLTDSQILELSDLIIRIENHYGFPCDIEWALVYPEQSRGEGETFYITQSRPITTLTDSIISLSPETEEYDLQFSTSGYSILLLDMIFNNTDSYGAIDYIVLYSKDVSNAYLSPKGLKGCRDLGRQLMDDSFYEGLLKRSRDLDEELKQYKVETIDEGKVISKWDNDLKLNNKFGRLYRFYETQFQKAIEDYILQFISKEQLVEAISTGDLGEISNEQVKLYIERLIEMGKMKLLLHKDSERYVSDKGLVDYVSKKLNMPLDLVTAMRVNEFGEAICGRMTVTVDELKERLKGVVFVREDGQWNIYAGDRYVYWKNKVQKVHKGDIRGSVAYRGVATGRVVVHLSWTDVTEIKYGDVLVTGMTNPQMIPMLKRASAIVTDEGGVTCHAAIIARELKKPCIIGTKVATQVLKDGDLVEVDAEKGIVKILEKVK